MSDNLAELRSLLKARKGMPGMAENVAEIEAMIESAETSGFVYKDAATGHFVSEEFAGKNRSTTYRLKVRR